MMFWIYKMFLVLLIPLVMIVGGKCFMKNATKEISAFGYRSSMSMKNKDTWKFANNYCGQLWTKMGWSIVIFSIIVMLLVMGNNKSNIRNFSGIIRGVQLIFLICSVFITENALKINFNKSGERK